MTGYRFKMKDFIEHEVPIGIVEKGVAAGQTLATRGVGGELLPEDSLSAEDWQSLDI